MAHESDPTRAPVVSVVMPVYNAGRELAEALVRLRALRYPKVEIIVVDDGSGDDTVAVATEFVNGIDVHLVRHEQNQGAAAARNTGLAHATGEFVWFVDWDDLWDQDILDRLVDEAVASQADIVIAAAQWRNLEGHTWGCIDGSQERVELDAGEAFDRVLRGRIQGYLWTKLMRRSVVGEAPFPLIETQEDLAGLVRVIARSTKIVCLPDVLYFHVVREGSLTSSRNPPLDNLRIVRDEIHAVAGSLPESAERQRLLAYYDDVYWHLATATTALRLSSKDQADEAVRRARSALSWASVLRALPVSRKSAASLMGLLVLGSRYGSARLTLRRVQRRLGRRPAEKRPRVLIRTLPLWRGNYGGTMQAFALQRVLQDLGCVAVTDSTERLGRKAAAQAVILQMLSTALRRPIGYRQRAKSANLPLAGFVRDQLETTKVFRMHRVVRRGTLRRFDLFVAGSDQVWRQEYGDVGSFLFDFVGEDPTRTRISYAASFGSGHPKLDIARTKELAAAFDRISVREQSAVQTCRDAWGIDAQVHVDPTLLLDPAVYAALAAGVRPAGSDDAGGGLLTYVLDPDGDKDALAEQVADSLGVGQARIGGYCEGTDVADTTRASMEEWLNGLMTADFVLTDSFHGCAFAIIFHRPFAVVGNAARGMARFESLLEILGLSDRLIVPAGAAGLDADAVTTILQRPVDWAAVEQILQEERARARHYLSAAVELAMSRRDH